MYEVICNVLYTLRVIFSIPYIFTWTLDGRGAGMCVYFALFQFMISINFFETE